MVGFFAAKTTVFVAPLFLSKLWDIESYGLFEYCLAWANLLAIPLGAGMPGAIPYFRLREGRAGREPFQLHAMLTTLLVVAVALLCFLQLISAEIYLVVLLAGITALQAIWSTELKVEEAPSRASFLESGIFIFILVLCGTSLLAGIRLSLTSLTWLLGVYVLWLGGALTVGFAWGRPVAQHLDDYKAVLRFGAPVIITSGLMVFLTGGGRVLVGQFLSMEAVGTYSLFFRVSSGAIIIQTLLSTILFRRIYDARGPELDRIFAIIMGSVFAVSGGLFIAGPIVLGRIFPELLLGPPHSVLFLTLSVQMLLWTGMGLAEGVLYRQNQARAFGWLLLRYCLLFTLGAVFMKLAGGLNLVSLAQLHMGCMLLALLAQFKLLRSQGLNLVLARAIPLLAALIYIGMLVWSFKGKPNG